VKRLACALVLGGLGACTLVTDSFKTNDFSGDTFEIPVEMSSGAIVVGLREGDLDRIAVLDTLSPITLVDTGIDAPPVVTDRTMIVLGQGATGALDLPRAQLSGNVLALHPCDELSCLVGVPGTERPYDAIVGADLLAGDALRLRLGSDVAFILADVAGDEQDRGELCDAVYPSPYRGGGTLVLTGTELGFSGRRITMPTCMGFEADPTLPIPQSARGTDALMLISTSIGPSLLGAATYQRYRLLDTAALPFEALPAGELYLPSGRVTGRIATIRSLALVARSSSTPRAACRHVYGHHLLLERDCMSGDDCPCEDGNVFCPMPALVELEPAAGHQMLVVTDDNATLQALRAELRPGLPEIDGILGTDVLRALELDVDYPHDRVLARCTSAAPDCTVRTALPERRNRARAEECRLGILF
jgi:hypothetical protein